MRFGVRIGKYGMIFAYFFEVILQNAYWQAWAIDGSVFASARPLNLVAFEALLS